MCKLGGVMNLLSGLSSKCLLLFNKKFMNFGGVISQDKLWSRKKKLKSKGGVLSEIRGGQIKFLTFFFQNKNYPFLFFTNLWFWEK